jgi:glycosyltransferase involved in cell wall biosynthesis
VRAVLFGTYRRATHPRVEVLEEGLQAHGIDVAECNEPLAIDTAGRVAILQQPWRLPTLAWRLASSWLALVRRARRAGRPEVVVVPYLAHFDVHLARVLFRRSLLVLDHLVSASDTARDRGEGGGLKLRLLTMLDVAALRRADIVMVDTEEHRDFVPERFRERCVVVPIGASEAWFRAARSHFDDGAGPLRVVFFGLYTPLQGTPVIARALAADPSLPVELTMVGGGQDRPAVEALIGQDQRVTWLDWVDPAELPALVARHHVCLGVFGTGPKARRVVPNKVYQGAAAGCVVITSDTAPQRRAFGDTLSYVAVGDHEALARELASLAAARLTADASTGREAGRAHALAVQRFRPEQAVSPLLGAFSKAGPSDGNGGPRTDP